MYAHHHHLGGSDSQVFPHLFQMQERQPVMPDDPVNQGYYHPSYTLFPMFVDKKVPFFNVNNAIDLCHQDNYLIFCAAATHPFLPPFAERPHMDIVTDSGILVSALIDCGAQVSMGDSSMMGKGRFKRVGAPIPVLDVHNQAQWTKGLYNFEFTIKNSNVAAASANIHMADNLSSDIIFGMDWLRPMGAVINARDNSVQFYPEFNSAVSSCLKPILTSGIAAAAAVQQELQDNEHFTISPIKDIDLQVSDARKVKVKINTYDNLIFKAGSKVVLTSGMAPQPCIPDGIYTVEDDNKFSVNIVNMTAFPIDLMQDRPIQGTTVESLAHYDPPCLTSKEDLVHLAQHKPTVEAVKNWAASVATNYGIKLDTSVHDLDFTQIKTDSELKAKLKESYRVAVSALEASGLPIPGQAKKPTKPPSKQVRDMLISQFAFKEVDSAYVERYRKLILANYDVFSTHKLDIGHCSHYQHRIEPVEGRTPDFQKQFPIPVNDEPMLAEFADTLTAAGVLIPTMQNNYNSAIFSVKKPNSTAKRYVQDYRNINKASKDDRGTFMTVKESLLMAGRSKPKIFSKIDSTSAYYHLSLAKESQPWTTFTLPFRNQSYMWSRLSQGLAGAASSFSKLMAIIFKDVPSTLTYVDDLICMCGSHPEMLKVLDLVFTECRRHGLKLSLHKCLFGVLNIEWLGFAISRFGISPSPTKLEFIKQMKPPETVKQIRSHLGFFQFLASNLEKFAWIAEPLSQLTSNFSPWISTRRSGPLPPRALEAWLELRRMALANPTLAFPDHAKPFYLFVDAAVGGKEERGGIAGVLCQVQEGRTRPIGFFSRKMRDSENFYTPFASELLAVSRSLDHFKHIIKGAKIFVYSDHRPLIDDNQKVNKTISNLAIKIQDFEADLLFIDGKNNVHADFVSRHCAPEPARPAKAGAPLVTVNSTKLGMDNLPYEDFARCCIGGQKVFSAKVSSITEAQWLRHQDEDPLCQALVNFVKFKKVTKSPLFAPIVRLYGHKCFINENGLLFLCDGKRGQVFDKRLWVPVNMKLLVMADAHGSQASGHFKQEIVVGTLLKQYFWPSMAVDVDEFVKACPQCHVQNDRQARRTRAQLRSPPPATYRNQVVYVDLIGPLKSVTPNKYVLDITDAYSHWVTLVPLPNKEALTVATAIFEHWVCIFGPMSAVHSDNGTEFISSVTQQLFQLMQTRFHAGCSYHPQSQGTVERIHRTIAEYLRIFVDESTTNWEEFLAPLCFALNTKIHSRTKMTAYWMTFAEHPLLPWVSPTNRQSYSESEINNKFRLLQFAHNIVNQNNLDAKKANKKYYDKLAKSRKFRLYDQVLVHYNDPPPGVNKKLFKKWRGPFSIAAVYDNDCYVVRKPSGRRTKVHVSRIKHFDPLNHPTEPDVLLSRDTDFDVAATDDVVGTDTVTQDAGAQTGEAEVACAAIPSPWIGVPLSHLAWLAAKQPPLNAFPDFV